MDSRSYAYFTWIGKKMKLKKYALCCLLSLAFVVATSVGQHVNLGEVWDRKQLEGVNLKMKLKKYALCCLLSLAFVVATSVGQHVNLGEVWAGKQLEGPNLVEMIMLGLAGIPVYRAVGALLPLLMGKRLHPKQKDSGRVLNRHRTRRDLAYAQQLLDLLISAETALEKYGVTEPQCQLKATCEIHKRNANAIRTSGSQKNFIKLVSEMRREIQNPRVVPLAKYVFEYYEEAAVRGEQQSDCAEMYEKCEDSMEHIFRKTKGKKSRRLH